MKRFFALISILFLCVGITTKAIGQFSKFARPRVFTTRWAEDVSPTNTHPEYPRPSMVRSNWLNLNGLWDFAITSHTQTNQPTYTNHILVPFPVESILSTANIHLVTELQQMWYRRSFELPKGWQKQRILLHFDAVDWETTVWVNGTKFGPHQGGYDRFTFDITEALKPEGPQELIVSVYDPSDSGFQPRGKQMLHPQPPFFHACSGIWQTVWLEPVPAAHIESFSVVPDIDAGVIKVVAQGITAASGTTVEITASADSKVISQTNVSLNTKCQLAIKKAKLWSPDSPFLYDLKLTLKQEGRTLDAVTSYFGMRKISLVKGTNGFPLLALNNRPLFEFGPLDQGYWPDGIYTAPTDEALRFDIETMKELGFNLCRKHVKIEPERWYYWCDKLGLLVWQDMPNGGMSASAKQKEIQRLPESAHLFEQDLQRMIIDLGNHPSIVMWIAFNQGWGQYDTARITKRIKELDPSRLVISASGWHDTNTGDVRSMHGYPELPPMEQDGKRACVIGECGGLGFQIPRHTQGGFTSWNTTFSQNTNDLTSKYTQLIGKLNSPYRNEGLAAAVVTQLTDVEQELNGFMTYDRAVIKMPTNFVHQLNVKLIESPDQVSGSPPATK